MIYNALIYLNDFFVVAAYYTVLQDESMTQRGFTVKGRHIVPYIFLALAVWVAASVPGEGVTAYTDVSDTQFIDSTYIGYTFDIGFKYQNSTPSIVVTDLTAAGTLNDFEFQMPASVADFGTATDNYLYFSTNKTVAQLNSAAATRFTMTLVYTDLGAVQPNLTSFVVYSKTTSASTANWHALYTSAFAQDLQINSSTGFTVTASWTLAALATHSASYSTEYMFIVLVFDECASFPFASEIWSGIAAFQYSEISIAQTWVYTGLGVAGFAYGAIQLLPYTDLGDEPSKSSRGRRRRGYRRRFRRYARRSYGRYRRARYNFRLYRYRRRYYNSRRWF